MRNIRYSNGTVAAQVDAQGRITLGDGSGPSIGLIRHNLEVFADEAGAFRIARIDADGRVFNEQHEHIGHTNQSGVVHDRVARPVGLAQEPIDGAVLVLIHEGLLPAGGPSGPAQSDLSSSQSQPRVEPTVMDEVLTLSQDDPLYPGVRRNYRPLTDDELFGMPKTRP